MFRPPVVRIPWNHVAWYQSGINCGERIAYVRYLATGWTTCWLRRSVGCLMIRPSFLCQLLQRVCVNCHVSVMAKSCECFRKTRRQLPVVLWMPCVIYGYLSCTQVLEHGALYLFKVLEHRISSQFRIVTFNCIKDPAMARDRHLSPSGSLKIPGSALA